MARLNYQSETEILSQLDHIKAKLHQNICDYEDSVWMVKKIQMLLYELHVMRDKVINTYLEDE